jgi:hypothetical protein
MNNQDKGYGEIRMIDSNYIEMCRALPKEVQDAIPETIETRWCNGYNIFLDRETAVGGYEMLNIETMNPPWPDVKKPFMVQEGDQLIVNQFVITAMLEDR